MPTDRQEPHDGRSGRPAGAVDRTPADELVLPAWPVPDQRAGAPSGLDPSLALPEDLWTDGVGASPGVEPLVALEVNPLDGEVIWAPMATADAESFVLGTDELETAEVVATPDFGLDDLFPPAPAAPGQWLGGTAAPGSEALSGPGWRATDLWQELIARRGAVSVVLAVAILLGILGLARGGGGGRQQVRSTGRETGVTATSAPDAAAAAPPSTPGPAPADTDPGAAPTTAAPAVVAPVAPSDDPGPSRTVPRSTPVPAQTTTVVPATAPTTAAPPPTAAPTPPPTDAPPTTRRRSSTTTTTVPVTTIPTSTSLPSCLPGVPVGPFACPLE